MATAIDAVLDEIESRRVILTPQYAGLLDYGRIDLKSETQQEIAASREQYERRLRLMEAAETALEALQADGHPEMPPRNISDAAYTDLVANASTIQSALGQFQSDRDAEAADLEKMRSNLQSASTPLADSVSKNKPK